MNQPKQATGKNNIIIFPVNPNLIVKVHNPFKGQICRKCMKQFYLCNCK